MSKSENLSILYDAATITLGTLGSITAITGNSKIDASRRQGFRVMKVEYWLDYYGKTANEGPIMVGWSPTQNASEIAETFQADPQGSDEIAPNANAKAPVFPLQQIVYADTQASEDFGKMGTFNPRWSTPEGVGAVWFAYNMGGAGLTTGTVVRVFAKYYGVWLRD